MQEYNIPAYNMNFNPNNNSDEQLFIACLLKNTRWNCNLKQMNLRNAENWLDQHNSNNNFTTLIPFNCKYSPLYFTKKYVNYKLNLMNKTNFIN